MKFYSLIQQWKAAGAIRLETILLAVKYFFACTTETELGKGLQIILGDVALDS